MNTKEAYEKAVESLCQSANRTGDAEGAQWKVIAVKLLWERLIQEGIAKEFKAFSTSQVISIVNSRIYTYPAVEDMKNNLYAYGALFQANILEST